MKIVHTADLHLAENAPERWEALKEITALAEKEGADLLVIAGDLFDHVEAAEKLRSGLRELFSRGSFKTLILPGNHDCPAYREGLYFGDRVFLLTDPLKPLRFNNLVFWGLPFARISGEPLVEQLRCMGAAMDPADQNILIYHGELLDAYFSRRDLGAEGEQRYMPVKLSYFEQLPLQYVLAGHFHARYAGWPLPGGGRFIYSGSPVAVTRRELGRRAVNLLQPGQEAVELLLDSCHYEELILDLDPLGRENPLDLLKDKLEQIHRQARLLLTVRGFFNGAALGFNESDLARQIRSLCGDVLGDPPQEQYADISYLLNDDLFKRARQKLEASAVAESEKEKALEMIIEAFRAVKS